MVWSGIDPRALALALTMTLGVAMPASAQAGAGAQLREVLGTAEVEPAEPPPPPPPPEPPRPPSPDPLFSIQLGVGAVHQAAPGFGLGGFHLGLAGVLSPLPLRVDDFAIEPLIGVALDVGNWGSDGLFGLGGLLGVLVRYGRFHGAYARASWTPGLLAARGRAHGVLSAWRVQAGAVIHPVRIGLGWQGGALENEYALHVYELVGEWCF